MKKPHKCHLNTQLKPVMSTRLWFQPTKGHVVAWCEKRPSPFISTIDQVRKWLRPATHFIAKPNWFDKSPTVANHLSSFLMRQGVLTRTQERPTSANVNKRCFSPTRGRVHWLPAPSPSRTYGGSVQERIKFARRHLLNIRPDSNSHTRNQLLLLFNVHQNLETPAVVFVSPDPPQNYAKVRTFIFAMATETSSRLSSEMK